LGFFGLGVWVRSCILLGIAKSWEFLSCLAAKKRVQYTRISF
jgi:hypothetical protein